MATLEDHLEANGARVSRLLIDKGTKAVRNIFSSIHAPATLNATLTSYRVFFNALRYVNCSQMDILFPPSGVQSKAEDYDITLLFILLRNICNLNPPVSTGSWNTNPPVSDTSMEANLVRIKYYRNIVYGHITSTGINDADFCFYWKGISTALISLGIDVGEIEQLKTSPLDKNLFLNQVKEWKENEEKLEVTIQECQREARAEREHHHKETTDNLNSIKKDLEQLKIPFDQGKKSIIKLEKNSNGEMSRKQSLVKKLKNKVLGRKKSKKEPQNDYNSGEHTLNTLVKCDFSGNIRKLNKLFHRGTRDWLLDKLNHWLGNEDSRVMTLTAGPGVGKSVFAAKVCQLFAENGSLAACHFCKFNYVDYSDPHKMLQSLALQMCENVRGFREQLIAQLQRDHSRSTVSDAFRVLLKDPLNSLPDQEPMLIVIDALDESETNGKSELLDLIEEEFSELPAFINVFLTSRPELPVQERLIHLNAVEIRPDHKNNKADLKSYLECCFKKHGIGCNSIEELVGRCEGSFLYAYHCQLELCLLKRKGKLFADGKFDDFIPINIGASYEKYFKRLERELKQLSADIDISQILEVLVAMQSPLPLGFVAEILKLPTDTSQMKKVICKVNNNLSALLLVYDDCLTVFHKTVVDWLLLSGKYRRHEFAVQRKAGHKRLWKACQETFMKLEHGWTAKEVKTTMKKYALDHGLQHLKEATFHTEIDPGTCA